MKEILSIISNATKTEGRHVISPEAGYPMITDGVKAVGDAAKCRDLLLTIGEWQTKSGKLDSAFQKWVLTVKDNKAKYRVYDKGSKRVITVLIPYVDTRLKALTLYLVDGTLMLPTEY